VLIYLSKFILKKHGIFLKLFNLFFPKSIGAEGMDLADGQNCMIADTPDKFAKKAVQVYTDKELWGTLSSNGIILAKEYSPERARACPAATISSIM